MRCVFCIAGHKENLYQVNLYATPHPTNPPLFFPPNTDNPSVDCVDTSSQEGARTLFWLVEWEGIAGCWLGILPCNLLLLCTILCQCSQGFTCRRLSLACFLRGCILSATGLWTPWALLLVCPCRAARPTDSGKCVYLLSLPTESNKENDLSPPTLIYRPRIPLVVLISKPSINCVLAAYLKAKHHKVKFHINLLLCKWKYPFRILLSICATA